jgi:hypothetical protein
MTNAIRSIIQLANSQGYFPTPAQAKEINALSAERYGKMREDRIAPLAGPVPADLIRECEDWAIKRVMEPKGYIEVTLTGIVGEELKKKIAAALAQANGKRVPIRIEEI